MNRQKKRIGLAIIAACAVLFVAQLEELTSAMESSGQQRMTPASTATRTCEVTSVHDGDSMRVRCPGSKKTVAIRLHQIDAPELDQSYGIKSRDYLRSICPRGKKAVIDEQGSDDYGRVLGRVTCNQVDANADMIKAGAAWVYDYHAEDRALYPLQESAKAQRRGLWADKNPVPPWEFRYQQRRRSP